SGFGFKNFPCGAVLSAPATLASAKPCTLCPPAPRRAISPSAIARKRHKMLQHFFRTIARANGIGRAPTPPGSLGTSPAARINLPPANSPLNAPSTLTSRYINVHFRDFKQQSQSLPARCRPYPLPKNLQPAQPGPPVRQSLGRAIQSRHLAESHFAARDHFSHHFRPRHSSLQPARHRSPVRQPFRRSKGFLHPPTGSPDQPLPPLPPSQRQ